MFALALGDSPNSAWVSLENVNDKPVYFTGSMICGSLGTDDSVDGILVNGFDCVAFEFLILRLLFLFVNEMRYCSYLLLMSPLKLYVRSLSKLDIYVIMARLYYLTDIDCTGDTFVVWLL